MACWPELGFVLIPILGALALYVLNPHEYAGNKTAADMHVLIGNEMHNWFLLNSCLFFSAICLYP